MIIPYLVVTPAASFILVVVLVVIGVFSILSTPVGYGIAVEIGVALRSTL